MELTDLPNIGPVLADNLRRVGITSPEQLRAAGACEAWLCIRNLDRVLMVGVHLVQTRDSFLLSGADVIDISTGVNAS